MLGAGGNQVCNYDTNQTVDSSTAVGNFLGGGAVGIAFGTGSYWPGASDTNTLFASDSHCNIAWRDNLGGNTVSSPAIGDVLGNSGEQVVEGVDTGTGGLVWALNGSNGAALPGWPVATPGRVIGGVTLADLTGGGYNDVLVPTTAGLEIFDGRSAQLVATLGVGTVALQNSPLVTIDPGGSIGITIAGYGAGNEGIIQHYVDRRLGRPVARPALVADVPPRPAADRVAGRRCARPPQFADRGAWPPPPTGGATGTPPPTVASSPSATPPSTARWVASR